MTGFSLLSADKCCLVIPGPIYLQGYSKQYRATKAMQLSTRGHRHSLQHGGNLQSNSYEKLREKGNLSTVMVTQFQKHLGTVITSNVTN